MNNFILVILLAVFISPTVSLSEDNKTSPRAILDDLQRGFWLNKTYLTQLLKTKSPQKAQVNIHESGFWVKKEDDKYPVLVGFDFHDSGTSFTITNIKKTNTKDVYDLVTKPEPYSNIKQQRVTLRKSKGGDEIQWKFTSNNNKHHDLLFVRVEPDLDQYVNKILLAGEYQDKNKQKFIFAENGKAIWPERSFKYEIDLDFVMSDSPESDAVCDHILFVDVQNRKVRSVTAWAFFLQNDRLLIYEPNKPCKGSKLLYFLKRIK